MVNISPENREAVAVVREAFEAAEEAGSWPRDPAPAAGLAVGALLMAGFLLVPPEVDAR